MRLFLLFLRLMAKLPNTFFDCLARLSGSFFYYCAPVRKRVIALQIRKTVGRGLTDRAVKRLIKANYVHYAKLIFESLILASLDLKKTDYFHKHCTVINEPLFKEALSQGRGVIAVCAHLGHWEALGACSALLLSPVTVAVKFIRNRFVQALRERMQAHPDIHLVDERLGRGRIVEMLKGLRNGEVVAVFMDQHRPAEDFAKFFGHDARTNSAAAVLARKTGASVFFSYLIRERLGKYVLHLIKAEPPVFPDALPEKEAVAGLINYYNSVLEAAIRAHPDQWLWAHRRFKDNPEFDY
jgi:KDO2-lipid IV(A) lauroyltransferase